MEEIFLNLGKRVFELRKKAGLTLNQMAEKIDMSPSLISQVERAMVKPSLDTLIRMSMLFGISAAYLIDDNKLGPINNKTSPVVQANERKTVLIEGGIKFSLLSHRSPNLEFGYEFMLIEYPPNCTTGKRQHVHEGVECGFVLEGTLGLEIENETFYLTVGDSVTYSSTIPHRTINNMPTKTVAVWVNSKPFIFST